MTAVLIYERVCHTKCIAYGIEIKRFHVYDNVYTFVAQTCTNTDLRLSHGHGHTDGTYTAVNQYSAGS